MIGQKEIEEARKEMGDYALAMTDEEMVELLRQIKKMVTLAVEIVEKEMG